MVVADCHALKNDEKVYMNSQARFQAGLVIKNLTSPLKPLNLQL